MASEAIMDLFNRSPLIGLVEHAFGTSVQSVRGAQLATLYPAEDDDKTNEAGYLNRDTPGYGWCPHLDGLWNGGIATPPLRGGHHHMERFFRSQRDQGGPLGPEGPGWPREDPDAPNGHGLDV
jgi:hypothetical protein